MSSLQQQLGSGLAAVSLLVTALAAQAEPSAEKAAGRLRAAYERVHSAEAEGLQLLKAGDIEIQIVRDGARVEWEDGLLWRAGFAPVIEHEAPGRVALRPESEELLMGMLGWGMGFEPWQRRFAGATFTPGAERSSGAVTIRVAYPDASRADEVFTIERGRITTVTNGTFRTSFEYREDGERLRTAGVSRIAVAAGAVSTPGEVEITFGGFDDVAGVVVATESSFRIVRDGQTTRFDSRLTKVRGNTRVSADDVDVAYSRWASRALRRAIEAVYSPAARGLTSLRCGAVVGRVTVGERAEAVRTTATWKDGRVDLPAADLPPALQRAIVRGLAAVPGIGASLLSLADESCVMLAAADPQRRIRISVGEAAERVTVTIEEGRLVAFVRGDCTTRLRFAPSPDGRRLIGFDELDGDERRSVSFAEFATVDGFVLPRRVQVTCVAAGGPALAADLELSELSVDG